jgi:GPH family glycoside/pentoside/hexuronide:cation symporter
MTREERIVRRIPTRRESWLYAIANLGGSIPYQAFSAVVLFFYTDVKNLNPATAATIMTVYAIWNALNNPLIGHLSDRTVSRWGRRLVYIRFGMIPFALAFAAIWLVPYDAADHPVRVALWFLVSIIVFEGLGTAVTVAGHQSLLAEMFPSYQSRVDVAVRMNWIQTVGLFVAGALPPILAEQLGYPVMGLVFALAIIVAYAIGLRGMYEQPSFAPVTTPFLEGVRAVLRNRSFLTVMFAQMMRFVATNTMTSGMFFYVKYSLNGTAAETTLVLASAFVSAAVMLPVWRRFIAMRFDPRTSMTIVYGTLSIAAIPLFFVRTVEEGIIAAIIVGMPVAGALLLGDVLLADVIDEDETRTGSRREAMIYSVSGAANALSAAITATYFGFITHLYGYDPLLTTQPTSVGLGFRVFMMSLPMIGGLLAVLVIRFYPIHGERLARLRAFQSTNKTPSFIEGGGAGTP